MNTPANGRSTRREVLSFLPGLAVLAASAFVPENPWVRAAMGKSRLGGELKHMDTRGYYEALIDANRGPAGASAAPAPDAPPPGWVPFGAAGIVDPIPEYLRWQMRPNLDISWNGIPFRTNSRGYRTPEIETPKPEEVYRIAFFGSSNTMGHGVGEDEPYPRLLERWLNERVAPGRRVEVVNLSVSGDSPTRRLVRMRREAAAYQPDWILCDATVLDPALEAMHLEAVVRAEPPIAIPDELDYVRHALDRAGISRADAPESIRARLRGEAETLLDATYQRWAECGRGLGVSLAVVIIPRADAVLPSPAVEKLMHAAIRRHRLDSIDLGDAFRGLSAEEFRVSPWDKHPSVRGHVAIFEAFCKALKARGSLPGLDLER